MHRLNGLSAANGVQNTGNYLHPYNMMSGFRVVTEVYGTNRLIG